MCVCACVWSDEVRDKTRCVGVRDNGPPTATWLLPWSVSAHLFAIAGTAGGL